MPKPSIDKPFWNAKVISEFKKDEKFEAGDILSQLADVLELTDYNQRDPDRTEYKVKRSFQIIVREG